MVFLSIIESLLRKALKKGYINTSRPLINKLTQDSAERKVCAKFKQNWSIGCKIADTYYILHTTYINICI